MAKKTKGDTLKITLVKSLIGSKKDQATATSLDAADR